jgi:hypothetical protein
MLYLNDVMTLKCQSPSLIKTARIVISGFVFTPSVQLVFFLYFPLNDKVGVGGGVRLLPTGCRGGEVCLDAAGGELRGSALSAVHYVPNSSDTPSSGNRCSRPESLAIRPAQQVGKCDIHASFSGTDTLPSARDIIFAVPSSFSFPNSQRH